MASDHKSIEKRVKEMSRTLELSEGKYRFHEHMNILKCDRNSQPWRSFLGDKAIWSLFNLACDLQDEVKRLQAEIAKATGVSPEQLNGGPTTAQEVKHAMQEV